MMSGSRRPSKPAFRSRVEAKVVNGLLRRFMALVGRGLEMRLK